MGANDAMSKKREKPEIPEQAAISARLDAAIGRYGKGGKSQQDLADETGIAQSSISAMTRGARVPYFWQAIRLAKATGTSLAWLAGADEEAPAPGPDPGDEKVLWVIHSLRLSPEEAVRRLYCEPEGGAGAGGKVRISGHQDLSQTRSERRRLGQDPDPDDPVGPVGDREPIPRRRGE